MNSRQRVKEALSHRQPDRIPLDLGGTESSGLTAIAYNRLLGYLGVEGIARVIEPFQQVVLVEEPVLRALEIDTVAFHYEPRRWKPSVLSDGSPCLIPEKWNETVLPDGAKEVRSEDGRVTARMPRDGLYFEPGDPPLARVSSPSQIDPGDPCITDFDLPAFSDETWEDRTRRAKTLRETGRTVAGSLCCHFLAAGQILRGYEDFMCDLLAAKDIAHALLEALCTAYIARTDRYVRAVGEYLDVILVNDDLGTQNGPMLSLELYREMIKPYQKRFFGHLRSVFRGTLLMHSCGAMAEFLPDLIECGVQAINPVQISARGMSPERLKSEFGKDIAFWGGGCDTQRTLNLGTTDDVRRHVQRNAQILGKGGGFVFTQVHNIQPDVPPENVVAMVQALRAIG